VSDGIVKVEQSLDHEMQGPEGTKTSDTYVNVYGSDVVRGKTGPWSQACP
jgi:hypothetical protein